MSQPRGLSTPKYLLTILILAVAAGAAAYYLYIRPQNEKAGPDFKVVTRAGPSDQVAPTRTRIERTFVSEELKKIASNSRESSEPEPPAEPADKDAEPAESSQAKDRTPAAPPTPASSDRGAISSPTKKTWALNVFSTQDPAQAQKLYSTLLTTPFQVYTYEITTGGKTWHRVRVGFFESYEEAKKAEALLMRDYKMPKSWIVQPNKEELAKYLHNNSP